ncbi:hypothetical protein [Actinoplanes sp. L3-i22]|uniref:hypothetical protein n=1 Tax=Actinoplanes sp. L3-i22 TaxID=2836373 RepID=UPI001C75E606|nr:hypothetical protein [Actinoplanes sp. L3-i22]BCY06864.1 hypothetical protein L3i22_019520 [Actinoplanes sp. L3-i22]
MSIARRPVPRPRRSHGATPAAVAAVAVATLAIPSAPAYAGGTACVHGRFAATSQADLAKITILDPSPLAPGLPALADVRLAPSRGDVLATNTTGRSVATASYADAKLLGMHLPGLPLQNAVANHVAPGGPPGPVDVALATLNAGGLATAQLGKATAAATWTDRYHCGQTGPLTRAATMVEGLSILGGAGTTPAIQAVSGLTHLPSRTSLLKVGPTGSTQSATDLVKLGGGRIGVRSGAGIALSDLTLFGGTPQEITAKVLNQPTLEAVAGGDRKHSKVTYQPAVLAVTAAGKPLTGLDSEHSSVSLSLLGKLAADRPAALLSVRLSLGEANQKITDSDVRADAAALRIEVKLGSAHLLDVALGYLSVSATAPCRVGAAVPRDQVPDTDTPPKDQPVDQPAPATTTTSPTPASSQIIAGGNPADSTPGSGALALTGANAAAVGLGGLALVVGGLAALFLTRRRRTGAHAAR